MAEFFLVGSSHKNYDPTPVVQYKRAVAADKSYDWEEIDRNDEADDGFPMRFRCPSTGIEAIQIHKPDAVKFQDGELLALTLEEQTVKDIIE